MNAIQKRLFSLIVLAVISIFLFAPQVHASNLLQKIDKIINNIAQKDPDATDEEKIGYLESFYNRVEKIKQKYLSKEQKEKVIAILVLIQDRTVSYITSLVEETSVEEIVGEESINSEVVQATTFQQDMLAAVNKERATYNAQQLQLHSVLNKVAQAHAEDMHQKDFFSHTNKEGLDFADRVKNA